MDRRSFLQTVAAALGGVFVAKASPARPELISGIATEDSIQFSCGYVPSGYSVRLTSDEGVIALNPVAISGPSAEYDLVDVTSSRGYYEWRDHASRSGKVIRKRYWVPAPSRHHHLLCSQGSFGTVEMDLQYEPDRLDALQVWCMERRRFTLSIDGNHFTIPPLASIREHTLVVGPDEPLLLRLCIDLHSSPVFAPRGSD